MFYLHTFAMMKCSGNTNHVYRFIDSLALLLSKAGLRDDKLVNRVLSHHVLVGGLMGWYLSAAARGKAKSIFFVASYMVRVTCMSLYTDHMAIDHEPLNTSSSSRLVPQTIYSNTPIFDFVRSRISYDGLCCSTARTVRSS